MAPLVFVSTQISFVGLFILAHDSIHGSLLPGFPRLNRLWGQLALFLYAGFDYGRLREAHHLHHLAPATQLDPDFHSPGQVGFWKWAGQFLRRHLDLTRVALFELVAGSFLLFGLEVAPLNLLFGWVLPSILSALQLFYFGTYLPHREPRGGYNALRAQTNQGGWLWSLLTCLHFGHHEAHHLMPWVPWWRLPEASERMNSRSIKEEPRRVGS